MSGDAGRLAPGAGLETNDSFIETSGRRPSLAAKTGYLTKRAMSTPGLNWKKRFFVLEGHYLFYFTSDKDTAPMKVRGTNESHPL